jgi:hypothetical protein
MLAPRLDALAIICHEGPLAAQSIPPTGGNGPIGPAH